MKTANKFGTVIRRIRERQGMSARALCREAGVSSATVNLMEHAKNDPNPKLAMIVKLAHALGTSASALVAQFEKL